MGASAKLRAFASAPSRSKSAAFFSAFFTNSSRPTVPLPAPQMTRLAAISGWRMPKFSVSPPPSETPPMCARRMPRCCISPFRSSTRISTEYAEGSFGTSDGG